MTHITHVTDTFFWGITLPISLAMCNKRHKLRRSYDPWLLTHGFTLQIVNLIIETLPLFLHPSVNFISVVKKDVNGLHSDGTLLFSICFLLKKNPGLIQWNDISNVVFCSFNCGVECVWCFVISQVWYILFCNLMCIILAIHVGYWTLQ